MKNKLLITNKPVLIVITAAIVLAAATGIAALLGVFGNPNAEDVPSSSDVTTTQEGSIYIADTETSLKITALDSDSLGVSPTSTFRLVFNKAPAEKDLAASLSVEPSLPFQLKKVSAGEYNMAFEKPLNNDSIYRFIFSGKNTGIEQSWAFQTKRSVNVLRTLPRDKGVQVPVNSGIEITFSHENIENADKFFEISPKTGGRFELHKKTLVFVPDKLEENTIYTITVKKGIGVTGSNDTLQNDYTFRFQTAVPAQDGASKSYFSFSDTLFSFTPESVPALQVYTDNSLRDTEVQVELFNYPDADSFLKDLKSISSTPNWVVWQNNAAMYDETKLAKSASVKARVITQQNVYWETNYILLPSSLSEGYYLAMVNVYGKKYYAQLQVNNASVYIMTTEDKTMAWLNDSATGKPLSGAELLLDGGAGSVKSDENGLAVLNVQLPSSSDISDLYFLVKPSSGISFVAQVRNSIYYPYYSNYYNSDTINDYWTYLYLDKGIYLPDDTVNVWGVIKPRDGSSSAAEAVLELIRHDYSMNGDSSISVLTSQNVKISPNGTITGNLKLSNFNPGSYEVRVKVKENILLTHYLQVMDYVKPVYKVDITQDRNYMYAWEKVNFTVQASFYEGTPVSGIKLNYNANIQNGNSKSGVLVSDASGISSTTMTPTTSDTGWRPLSLGLGVDNTEAEEQPISAYSQVAVFPKDTMIEVLTDPEGEKGSATIMTSRIDLSKLEGKTSGYYSEDEYRGASVDIPLTARLYERHYEKKKNGEYYDYINKVKRNTYVYNEVQNLVSEYSFQTVGGKYDLKFSLDKDKNYYLEVYGNDSSGRPIKETRYLYNWVYYNPFATSTYSIDTDNTNKQYRLDESVSVSVKYNPEEPFTGNKRRYLFVRMKNGVLDFKIQAEPSFSFTYDKTLIPNMYVKAVCFDGNNIFDAGIQQYTYDRTQKQLSLTVQPDKESYKPGDTVKLSFNVKDTEGKPCSSEINVSIIDEAYFSISEQYVDTLYGLYGPAVSSGLLSDYFSYKDMYATGNPMAEGGEGGDMNVRKDFRDSALFTTVTSGSDGKAEASFKLPDNLTSWRITYQGITEDLKAGNGKVNISSKLPFFVDTIFNKVFITGDSPSIIARAYGTELSGNALVDYKITVRNSGGETKTFTSSGKAKTISEIPLGSLTAGNYTVQVEASSGTLRDALERSFKVSDSLLETTWVDHLSLSDNAVISNKAKGLTTLIFSGESSSILYTELHKLYWNHGQRLDQKLAVKTGGELLQKYFNEEIYRDGEIDISKYQTEDGGLALLTYDSSNPALSAKMCSLASDNIDRMALASYFRRLLESDSTIQEDIAYTYWGLAALKEPVLLDIQRLLEAKDNTPQIKLILGVALAEMGDFQGAQDVYKDMMEKMGKVTDTFAYLEFGTRDESIDATALCSLIALKTNAPEKLKLFNYINSNSTSELLVNLERMIFVTNYIKDVSLDSSFSYELDGVKKQVDLKEGSHYRLTLTSGQLAGLKFSNVQGKVTVAASYVTPVSEATSGADSPVSLSRTYSGGSGTGSSFSRSDTIRITLTPVFGENAPDGYYEITDILPAGFRYERGSGNSYIFLDEFTGQKVVFGYYYKKGKATGSIVYYARAVTSGTFTADNAVIRHTDTSIAGFTGKVQVVIGK